VTKQKFSDTGSSMGVISRRFYTIPGLLVLDKVVLGILICLVVITMSRTFIFGPLLRRVLVVIWWESRSCTA